MAEPENVKEDRDSETSINEIDDSQKLRWLGGYFDIKGSCSLTMNGPMIQILNANPKVAILGYSIFKRNGILANISERSKPSKSSKKKRWDLFITEKQDIVKSANLLKDFIFGKKEQLELLLKENYSVEAIKEMKYLNAANNILIYNDNELFKSIGFEKKGHSSVSQATLEKSDFCDVNWLAGVMDAIGMFNIDLRALKSENMYKCTPYVKFEHFNKKVVENVYSTLKNLKIGCHVSFFVSEIKNRGKWTITVSGFKRIKFLSHSLLNHLLLKKEHLNLMNLYVHKRLKEPPNSIDELGYGTKHALDEMEKNL